MSKTDHVNPAKKGKGARTEKLVTPDRGEPRGFGFISFGDAEQARAAIGALKGMALNYSPSGDPLDETPPETLSMGKVHVTRRGRSPKGLKRSRVQGGELRVESTLTVSEADLEALEMNFRAKQLLGSIASHDRSILAKLNSVDAKLRRR